MILVFKPWLVVQAEAGPGVHREAMHIHGSHEISWTLAFQDRMIG